jgi:hypothetical protein
MPLNCNLFFRSSLALNSLHVFVIASYFSEARSSQYNTNMDASNMYVIYNSVMMDMDSPFHSHSGTEIIETEV